MQVAGKKFTFQLRPERTYRAASLTLLQVHPCGAYAGHPGSGGKSGRSIPKRIFSQPRAARADFKTGENREGGNLHEHEPLRYGGETFYQASFDKSDPRVSVLQVVHNPSWMTPYIGCILVALGLVIQFLSHLIKFIAKSAAPYKTSEPKPRHSKRRGPLSVRRAQGRRRLFANEKSERLTILTGIVWP